MGLCIDRETGEPCECLSDRDVVDFMTQTNNLCPGLLVCRYVKLTAVEARIYGEEVEFSYNESISRPLLKICGAICMQSIASSREHESNITRADTLDYALALGASILKDNRLGPPGFCMLESSISMNGSSNGRVIEVNYLNLGVNNLN